MTDHRRTLIFLATTALIAGLSAAGDPVRAAQTLADATAVWGMESETDGVGRGGALTPVGGEAEFGVSMSDEDRLASRAVGGDGLAVRLNDAALVAGEGIGGALNPTGDQLTVLMRLRNDTENWDLTLLGKHGGHDRLQYNLYSFDRPGDSGAELGFEFYTPDGYHGQRPFVDSFKAGRWVTIVGRYDGAGLDLFVDGRRVASAAASGPLRPSGGQPLVIAGEETGDGSEYIRRFTGLIDHVAIWDRALSTEEIESLSPSGGLSLYDEPHRPQFHFSPERNWTNDPNGLLYHNGRYHLFYQYNPFGDRWGHMSWGHAVSPDLLHWEHRPVALREAGDTMIWSGSAVFDRNNTSGLGSDESGPLVAVYTARKAGPPEVQSQAIAFSNDDGVTWTKYAENPVLDIGHSAFRDPRVFWYEPEQKWVMAVVVATEHKVRFYESKNLIDWSLTSEFGPAGVRDSGLWECPELFELPLDGDPDDTKWILQVSIGKSVSGGTGGLYFVGRFDGDEFVNENPDDLPLWVDYGRDFYALQSFNGIPDADGRRIWLGWANNWVYANEIPTSPWRGSMSIPREVRLVSTEDGPRLTQRPVSELESLRGPAVKLGPCVIDGSSDPLDALAVEGQSFDIELVFEPLDARRFGIRVLESESVCTEIGYDLRLDEMYVNRRHSGDSSFTRDFGDHQWAPLKPGEDGLIRMRILVDRSVVEAFGGDGRAVITSRVFPGPTARRLSLFTDGGSVRIESARIYPMRSVWSTP